MGFSDFNKEVAFWCQEQASPPLECWVDGLNVSLHRLGSGVRCSVELLDRDQSADPACLYSVLIHGGASLASECRGALARDPEDQCLKLLVWLPDPVDCEALLVTIGDLVDQRTAWLSLVNPHVPSTRVAAGGRTVLRRWQEGSF